jgi:hypothetical protein
MVSDVAVFFLSTAWKKNQPNPVFADVPQEEEKDEDE